MGEEMGTGLSQYCWVVTKLSVFSAQFSPALSLSVSYLWTESEELGGCFKQSNSNIIKSRRSSIKSTRKKCYIWQTAETIRGRSVYSQWRHCETSSVDKSFSPDPSLLSAHIITVWPQSSPVLFMFLCLSSLLAARLGRGEKFTFLLFYDIKALKIREVWSEICWERLIIIITGS